MSDTVTVRCLHPAGQEQALRLDTGQSLMRAATAAGLDEIVAMCGGCLSCATCHVIVEPEWAERLPPPGEDEEAMLEMTAAPREPGSRLACQIWLEAALDGLTVRLPAEQ